MEQLLYISIVLLAVLAVLFVRLRRYRKNVRKVKFMFDAIDNIDYAFKFPTTGVSASDEVMNSSLNRIKQILQNARDEAMEREKYYEQIINSVETGIMVIDDKGHVLQHNQAILRLLDTEVLTNLNHVKEKLESGNLSKKETRARLKDKNVSIVAVSDINNEINNAELDSWTKLIRVLTHEIMNSVTPITSLSETLLERVNDDERNLKDGLEVIYKTSRDLTAFVENYRKFTRIPTPVPALFDARPFFERMLSLARNMPGDKQIELHLSVEPDNMIIYADESLVAHVVTNILKNAVQSIDCKGNIWVKARIDEREAIIIDIPNDGPPIADDVAAHIFVPFFTTKKDGSGIGLSLARQLMRACGGSLQLLRDKKHQLTTFRLTLP